MSLDEIHKINDEIHEKINTEIEIRVRQWLKCAKGFDWEERFRENLRELTEARERIKKLEELVDVAGRALSADSLSKIIAANVEFHALLAGLKPGSMHHE